MKHVYLYVLNTLADWEPGYLLAELNTGRFLKGGKKWPVKTVGVSDKPVHSMGGLTITPDATVSDLKPENVALLVLPGADTWAEKQHAAILKRPPNCCKRACPWRPSAARPSLWAKPGCWTTARTPATTWKP